MPLLVENKEKPAYEENGGRLLQRKKCVRQRGGGGGETESRRFKGRAEGPKASSSHPSSHDAEAERA